MNHCLNQMSKIYLTRRNKQYEGLKKLAAIVPGGIMVEIGPYTGTSTEIFATTNKFDVIYAVDPWRAGYDDNDELSDSDMVKVENIFDNIQTKYPCIRKIKKSSVEAALQFDDNSLDFVYIDACHQYENVVEDINIWLPKVKHIGWLGGHDFSNGWPRVKQAVLDTLGTPHHLFADGSWIIENSLLIKPSHLSLEAPHLIEITDR